MDNNKLLTIDHELYERWLQQLCEEIDRQRLRAVMQLNAATLQHYWWMGNDIIQKQREQGWGGKVIEMLSADLLKRNSNFASETCKIYDFSRWRICTSAACTDHLVSSYIIAPQNQG
ncbi:MAG: hypothetical protein IKX59_08190 [Bacteroidales bacterium]|nr:hypothetical protein [Bacteroidales bacterium]